jgi:hypothetical protein
MILIIYFAFFLSLQLTDSYRTSITSRHSISLLAGFRKSISAPLYATVDTIDTPIVPVDITLAESIKKGVVLLAQPSEDNDFFNRAAILIYNCGSDQGCAGVILGRETGDSFIIMN